MLQSKSQGIKLMLSFSDLVQYLKNKHSIKISTLQEQDLRNIGYYHGYKGYRFIRTSNNKIPFSDLKEITALNKFDLDLKSLFYPKIMFIETALKSYFVESLLEDAQTEDMADIYSRTITNYKSYQKGSKSYAEAFKKRMNLQMKVNSALIRDYQKGKDIEKHFFNNDKSIPVWAVFESLTLGEFGNFFDCSNLNARVKTSKLLGLPTKFDSDGLLISYIIYTLRDLRNAIAHNSVIFDTRFKTSKINQRLISVLENETLIKIIDFKYISSYVILISYILKKLKLTKDCKSFIHEYLTKCDFLFQNLPSNICFQILGTNNKPIMTLLENYIKSK